MRRRRRPRGPAPWRRRECPDARGCRGGRSGSLRRECQDSTAGERLLDWACSYQVDLCVHTRAEREMGIKCVQKGVPRRDQAPQRARTTLAQAAPGAHPSWAACNVGGGRRTIATELEDTRSRGRHRRGGGGGGGSPVGWPGGGGGRRE